MEEEDDDDDDGDSSQAWGTAKQSQSSQPGTTPTKPTYGSLAELFTPDIAPLSGSQITVRAKGLSKDKERLHREASSDSTGSSDNAATIKLGKADVETLQSTSRSLGHDSPNGQSSCSSSPLGTQRSRQPSVLSRLSAFSDEAEEEDYTLSPLQETPKKKWMHVRDGSAFEHAGPKPYNDPSPSKGGGKGIEVPTLIAGPPPLRPSSIAVELPSEEMPSREQQPQITASKYAKTSGKQARALYAFAGEATFNELTLAPGQTFEIINEDVSGGWSLALAKEGDEWRRGLVPRGWYTYIQDFTRSPAMSAEEGEPVSKIAEPSTLILDHQGSDATVGIETTSSSWLSPPSDSAKRMTRSNSGSSVLSPEEARDQQRRWDRSRPASGMGELYSGITEAGSAMQALTNMQRSGSSTFVSRAGPVLLGPAIKENEQEDSNASGSSFDSDGVYISTDATSHCEDGISEVSMTKSNSSFVSVWKPSAIFGGRSLNRFVPFVTSGAEEYLLFGKMQEGVQGKSETRYDVVSGTHGGPSWKHPGLSIFVEVHSPEVQIDELGKQFTAFVVHSSYLLQSEEDDASSYTPMPDPHRRPDQAALTSSVYRRFNQFKWLSTYLNKHFPFLMLSMPSFPSANYATGKTARFESQFVEKRRRQLQTWLFQVARHPILSNDVGVRFFLDSEEEGEDWVTLAKETQQHVYGSGDASMSLFTGTFHPLFNVDMTESALEAKQITMFSEAYQRGLSTPETGMLSNFKVMRETTAATSDSYRQLSYSLLRLITGSSHTTGKSSVIGVPGSLMNFDNHVALPPMGNVGRRDASGATNEERAWCWREGCLECKKLTRSLQGTAEALQLVADFYESHSNSGLFELHDRLVTMSKLNVQHASVTEVHKATLTKYRQATGEPDPLLQDDESEEVGQPQRIRNTIHTDAALEQLSSRSETVVNVTTSEMDRIHQERVQDWNSHTSQLLDSQIGFYEDILSTLRRAKSQFEQTSSSSTRNDTAGIDGPILPSPYESQLNAPIRASPLLQPDSQSSYLGIWN